MRVPACQYFVVHFLRGEELQEPLFRNVQYVWSRTVRICKCNWFSPNCFRNLSRIFSHVEFYRVANRHHSCSEFQEVVSIVIFFHTFALCLALTVSFFVTRIQKSVKRRSKKHFTKNFSFALDHISYRNCREANHRIEDITAMHKKSVTIIKQTNRFFKVINLIEESFN